MQWTQLDLEAGEWRYLVSKTQTPHIVPLSRQAVAILRCLERVTGHGLNLRPDAPRYVFPTPKTRLRPLSENAIRQALRNLGFTNDEASAHGFRAMARSLLAELGWPTDAIERQLAHKAAGPLGAAYDRAQFLPIRRRMMQAWADYLDALRENRKEVPSAPVKQIHAPHETAEPHYSPQAEHKESAEKGNDLFYEGLRRASLSLALKTAMLRKS